MNTDTQARSEQCKIMEAQKYTTENKHLSENYEKGARDCLFLQPCLMGSFSTCTFPIPWFNTD